MIFVFEGTMFQATPSVLDAGTQMFPDLTQRRSNASVLAASCEESKREKSCSAGDTGVPFFVLLSEHGNCAAGPER